MESYLGFHHNQMELIPHPTRTFEVGQSVHVGNLKNCIVDEILNDGKLIQITYTNPHPVYGGVMVGIWPWFEVFPGYTPSDAPMFRSPIKFHPTTRSIESFVSFISSDGVVCDPEYQRGYVWSDEDADALITSIFDGIDIGALLLVSHSGYLHAGSEKLVTYRNLMGETVTIPEKDDYTAAIIDGQQRLTTILRFVTGHIKYRGFRFDELDPRDRNHFMNYSVSVRIVNEDQTTKKEIMGMFIKLNRGVPQTNEHMDDIRAKYEALE